MDKFDIITLLIFPLFFIEPTNVVLIFFIATLLVINAIATIKFRDKENDNYLAKNWVNH